MAGRSDWRRLPDAELVGKATHPELEGMGAIDCCNTVIGNG